VTAGDLLRVKDAHLETTQDSLRQDRSAASRLGSPLVTAVGLGVASCVLHAVLPRELGHEAACVVLGALGAVYLGGALHEGSEGGRGGRVSLAVAAVGAAVFVVLGVVGLRGPAWVVPAGFLLHGVWDWAHHAMERRTVGRWWPPFCALFDVIFGVYLMVWG
jgi:hypothetical protein